MKVLDGIRVVEQGTFITGPCAAMMLADLGADVIKVESPGKGDPYRSFKNGLYSAHFQAYNRNKRSIAIDMKKPEDRAVFHSLIASADVYIQNFRPGAAERMGAGPDALRALNERLVYASISGFGKDGPYKERPSYDSVTQALSGFLGVAIDPTNPRLLGPALADAITGLYAALGTMGALVQRGRTGTGSLLEVSMLEAMMHFAVEPFMGYFALGEVPTGLDRPRLAQAFIVRCSDDRFIGIHLSSLDKFWDALVEAIGGQSLMEDARFSTRLQRIDHYIDLLAALNAIFDTADRDTWLNRLEGCDLPYAPVNSVPEAMADPQVQHLGMIVPVLDRIEGATQTLRSAFRFDGACDTGIPAAPLIDQHGQAIREAIAANKQSWPVKSGNSATMIRAA